MEGGSSSNVCALKADIEEAEGASRDRQELFMLVESAEEGREEPLSNDFEIESACTGALCVEPEEEWEWDAASDLIKDKMFELSGPNSSIATKIDQDHDWKSGGGGDRQAHHLDEASARQCRLYVDLL